MALLALKTDQAPTGEIYEVSTQNQSTLRIRIDPDETGGSGPTIGVRFTLEPNIDNAPQMVTVTSTGGWPEAVGANFIVVSFNSAGLHPVNVGVCGAYLADELGNVSAVLAVPGLFLDGGDVDLIFQAFTVTT